MDEEKLKKLKLRIAYLRKIGKEGKAMNLEKKISDNKAKEEYKKERGPTGVGKIIKKIKKKVVETAETVKDKLPEITIKKKEKKQ
tara:strand:- start:5603 stop:5857 length:255 start_codon:yes stop_codon:yes gene_type:complete